jgi:signal transduction histidine kinase
MQTALRKRTERAQASAVENGRIRTALDRVSTGAMLADASGRVICLNDAALALLHYRRAAQHSGRIRSIASQHHGYCTSTAQSSTTVGLISVVRFSRHAQNGTAPC